MSGMQWFCLGLAAVVGATIVLCVQAAVRQATEQEVTRRMRISAQRGTIGHIFGTAPVSQEDDD